VPFMDIDGPVARATTYESGARLFEPLHAAMVSVAAEGAYLLLASSERIAILNRKRVRGGGGPPGTLRLKAKLGDLMCGLAVLKTREDSR
jgi:hypothetical protein